MAWFRDDVNILKHTPSERGVQKRLIILEPSPATKLTTNRSVYKSNKHTTHGIKHPRLKTLTCIQNVKYDTCSEEHSCPRLATLREGGVGGWQGVFGDSWWKAGVSWLLEGADSGGICASCCSAIVETLKVNYNINDRALQAVVPYYASIIPCMSTQRHREGIDAPRQPPQPQNTSTKKPPRCEQKCCFIE